MLLKDPYEILGVPKKASAADIKAAYRKLARERHPDRDPDNPWAEDEFKELNQAYALLSDPSTRGKYDRGEIDGEGHPRRQRGGGPKRPNKRRNGAGVRVNGADVEYDLTVSFIDAARGCIKYVSMTNGKRLKVSIPPGTEDRKLLRLRGQGMPGLGGGTDGDALVEVSVQPDPVFSASDTDIHVELAITLPEAVLGAKVEAPTIDGPVTVSVPPKSNTGSILRLKGKGLPKGGKSNSSRGDQYVTLKVVLPANPDDAFVDFVSEWSRANSYKVRPKS